MTDFRHFQIEDVDGVTVIQLNDPRLFDTILISELDDELVAYVETIQPRRVVVDFAQVDYCSSAVINSLLRVKKRLIPAGGTLRLCGMHDSVRAAYKLLNLDGTVFDIYPTRTEALQSL